MKCRRKKCKEVVARETVAYSSAVELLVYARQFMSKSQAGAFKHFCWEKGFIPSSESMEAILPSMLRAGLSALKERSVMVKLIDKMGDVT